MSISGAAPPRLQKQTSPWHCRGLVRGLPFTYRLPRPAGRFQSHYRVTVGQKISDPAILPAISPLVLGVRGTMVDIGLGPTNGFSYVSENLLGDDHLVVSRQMSTIAPAC